MGYFVVVRTTRDTALAMKNAIVYISGPVSKVMAIRNWKLYNNSVYGKYPLAAQIAETYGPHLEEKENKNG